nr:hypothetical protein [Nonlabens ulvanivorans]
MAVDFSKAYSKSKSVDRLNTWFENESLKVTLFRAKLEVLLKNQCLPSLLLTSKFKDVFSFFIEAIFPSDD